MKGLCGRAVRLVVAGGIATVAVGLGCAGPAAADWLGDERPLTTGSETREWPQLSGDRLVYADHSNDRTVGGPPETLFDIRVRDLGTGRDENLTPDHTAIGRPAISGTRVVWSDYGTGADQAIAYLDLATGKHRRLATGPGLQVAISGKRLCYELQGRVHVYDLATNRDRAVSPAGSAAGSCDISGATVVWQEHRFGHDLDIFAYNLSTATETRLSATPTDQSLPRIDGDEVIWQDQLSATNSDIFAYDLSTSEISRITNDDSVQWFADVEDGRIVWMDERNGYGNTEIYLYDLASRVETRVSDREGWTGNPTVAGDRIVYEDTGGSGHSLYLRKVTPPHLTTFEGVPAGRSRPELTGSLHGADGRPVSDETVVLEASADGAAWWPRETAVTGLDGGFNFTVDAVDAIQRVRVRFVGSPEYPAVIGDEQLVRGKLLAGLLHVQP